MNKLPCVFLVAALGLLCAASAAEPKVSDEAVRDFEWFATLGYPRLKETPWVEVTRTVAGKPSSIAAQGFLLKAEPDAITILPLDLRDRPLKRKMAGFMGEEALAWEEKPFAEVAREYLVGLDEEEKDPAREYRPFWGLRMGMKAQAFIMAEACWEKGLPEQAQAIFEATKKVPSWNMGRTASGKDATLREEVERELAHAATWRAVLAFGGPEFSMQLTEPLVPRQALLVAFQNLEKNFPHNPHREQVRRIVTTLEQMVAEDAKHPLLSPQKIAALPVEEQVREWIFRLRDQNGRQWSQPGYCEIFGNFGGAGDKETPAHQLVRIGYPAVPQLIAALDDDRLTRSVGFGRDYFYSHEVLTVSDCAQQILNRIARQTFLNSVGKVSQEHQAQFRADFRAAVEKWWKAFQDNGEEQSMVAEVSQGMRDPRKVITRLKEIAPGQVEAAVISGTENSGGNSLYLGELGALGTPAARSCLSRYVKTGDSLRTRVDAARELLKLGDPAAVTAMIAEWNALPPDVAKDEDWGHPALIQVLVVSGEKRAIDALAKGWKDRCPDQRRNVIYMIGEAFVTEENKRSVWGVPRKSEPGALRASEALLVESLGDLTVCAGYRGALREYAILDPRIADFGLFALSQNFPKDYKISVTADVDAREADRLEGLRVWDKKSAAAKAKGTDP
jgi:hypothetical protein